MGRHGICSLSIVPVRAEPSDKAEITTQLIFGDLYSEMEISDNQKWMRIKIDSDGYEGWIDFKQGNTISESDFGSIKSAEKRKTSAPITRVFSSEQTHLLVAGSTLYLDPSDEKLYYGGYRLEEVLKRSGTKDPDQIIPLAKTYLNVPYLWGGKSHFGIDCSGFVQQVYGICGYHFPRDAWQQEQIGEKIEVKQIQPMDLAFFKNDNGRIIHVGIMLEDHKIIHASGKVRIDILDEIGIFKKETNDYSHKLASIKRVVN